MIKYIDLIQSRKMNIILALLVLVPLFIAFSGILNQKVEAAWYSNDWYYRRQINIASHTSTENNVYITAPSFDATDTAKFQSDCGDLRFTKISGELLQYYVVDCDTTANIHVLFDTLPSGASSFYMYYGNTTVVNGFSDSDFSTAATNLGAITFESEEKGTAPIAWWKFDQTSGTTLQDSTSNQISGTLTNMDPATDWVSGSNCQLNGCLDFDGANDYINIADNSKLKPTSHFSISAWFKTSLGTQQQFFSAYSQNTLPAGIILGVNAANSAVNKVSIMSGRNTPGTLGTGYQAASSTSNVNDGQWHHVVGIWNGTNLMLYLDGKLEASVAWAFSPVYAATSYIHIGNHQSSPSTQIGYLNGSLDNLKIYDYALNEDQVRNDMSTSTPIGSSVNTRLPTPLIHYKMDEQSGQVVNNSSASNYSSRLGNTSSSASDDPTWNNEGVCKTNGCLSFDGNDFVITNDSFVPTGVTQFSVSLWVKTTSTSRVTLTHGGHVIYISHVTAGKVTAAMDNSSAGNTALHESKSSVNDGNWHHIAVTNNGTMTYIYINGVLENFYSETLALTTSQLTLGRVGGGANNNYLTGSLDEVKFYTVALSSEQVRLDYNAGAALNVGSTSSTLGASLTGGNGNAPVAEYLFSENTGTSTGDTSTNNATGTLNNGTTWSPGKIGSAISLDGVDDNVTFPSSTPLNIGTSDFTIEAYVKGNNIENTDIIVGKSDGGSCSTTYGYLFGVFDSLYPTLYFCSTAGSQAKIQGTQALSNNQWYHIAVVVDRDSTVNTRMYVDGVPVTTTVANLATHTGSITNTVNLAIGSESDNGFNWNGEIDQVRIYNYVRNQTQVMYNFNKGEPIGWWKFDQTSGTTAYDSSHFASNGTLVNMDGNTDWITDGTCPINNCLDFDNINDTVTVPYSTRYDPGNNISVSAWVYPRSYATCVNPDYADFVISKGVDNVVGAFYISICTGGTSTFVVRSNSGGHSAPAPVGSVPLNQWTHLIGTFDGTNVRLYVNGVVKGSLTLGGAVTVPAYNAPIRIGSNAHASFPYYFNGMIDDVRIYKYPLSAAQAQQVYNKGGALFYE